MSRSISQAHSARSRLTSMIMGTSWGSLRPHRRQRPPRRFLSAGEFTSIYVPGALGTGNGNSGPGINDKGEIVGGYLWTDMKTPWFSQGL